jgi:hypothetical protein
MQDCSTGELKTLNHKFFEGITSLSPFEQRERLQLAMDDVQPDRSKQGPVFQVGEILEIRGGRFKVKRIKPNRLYLDSLPAV